MIEQTNIETVWLIEDNELKKANKRVAKVNYNGTEIAVLKTEVGSYGQEYLFKDKDNEYWKMNIAGIEFKKFINASLDSTLTDSKNYCDRVIEKLSTFDLKEFFTKKIERKNYFNKCELAYISKYFPNMYDMAKNSREEYIAENKRIDQEALKARKQQEMERVKEVNTEFKKQLKELKKQIYSNGAIQGFINNRLTAYHFEKQIIYFKETSNKRCSTALSEYLHQIQKKVKVEHKKQRVSER